MLLLCFAAIAVRVKMNFSMSSIYVYAQEICVFLCVFVDCEYTRYFIWCVLCVLMMYRKYTESYNTKRQIDILAGCLKIHIINWPVRSFNVTPRCGVHGLRWEKWIESMGVRVRWVCAMATSKNGSGMRLNMEKKSQPIWTGSSGKCSFWSLSRWLALAVQLHSIYYEKMLFYLQFCWIRMTQEHFNAFDYFEQNILFSSYLKHHFEFRVPYTNVIFLQFWF